MAQERLSNFIVKSWDKYLNDDIKNMISIKSFNPEYLVDWNPTNSTTNILTIDRLFDSIKLMNRVAPTPILLSMKFEPYFDSEASLAQNRYFTYFNNIILKDKKCQIVNTLMNS